MPSTDKIALPSFSVGTEQYILFHRFKGRSGHKSVYIQAGTHADEHPGLLVAQFLIDRLSQLEEEGRLLGDVVVCPYANPVGMTQETFGSLTGRYSLENGENFNRNFPDISEKVKERIRSNSEKEFKLSELKSIFLDECDNDHYQNTLTVIRSFLFREAIQHDILLDLHSDSSSELHVYSTCNKEEQALSLTKTIESSILILEEEAGGFPLDEAYSKTWKAAFEECGINEEEIGFSATIELRGKDKVCPTLAMQDCEGIIRFLSHEGTIQLEYDLKDGNDVEIYPLEGLQPVKSDISGLVIWKKSLGERVEEGEVIAEVMPLDRSWKEPNIPVKSSVDGVLLAKNIHHLVRQGQRIGKLVSKTPAQGKGGLFLHGK